MILLCEKVMMAPSCVSTVPNHGKQAGTPKRVELSKLAIRPPISYVPPTDLHSSTESETIKVKLPDGTTVSVKAFSSGNNEDYILHWAAIFRLFDQKGLKSDVEVRAKLAKNFGGKTNH